MLHLYNRNKEKIKGLKAYKDYCIESTLSSGDKVLSFIYPESLAKDIEYEGYIRNKTDEYVIKEIEDNYQGDYKKVVCYLNIEELEGKEWERFDSVEQTIENCLNFAIVGTGWTVKVNGTLTKKRTVRLTNKSALDIIKQARKTYRVEISYNTLLKQINVYEVIGSDKGVYFIDSLNLKNIKSQGNTYDFYTRLVCIGATSKDADGNDTTIKSTIENHQYSAKNKTLIWKDERYTNIESLTEDGTFKLNEISKPYVAYSLEIIDLAKLNPKYSILDYQLGDTVKLISKEKNIKEKHRVITITEYPDEPAKNRCEVANSILTFQDIQQEMYSVADTVYNITSDDGTISESAIRDILSSGTVDKVIIQRLEAVEATIGRLDATYAKITDLEVINGHIQNLNAEVAKIGKLEADVAKIGILEADVGYIKDLVNGNLTSDNIHSLILTSDKVTVENGFIKNAMIESLDVSKVNAGKISTNKFEISSDDGGIVIVGATQQFRDSKGNVRLQLGQDAQGGFNFILRGEDGTSVLIDHTGIKEKAITNDLIKENMIAENAVGAKQIDYSSFAEGFNADTNTTFIKATHIKLNNQNQTLDVAFNEMTTTVNGHTETLGTNTTAIGVHQGQISALISNTTITKENGVVVQLKDEYNTTVATVNTMQSTISAHTTNINKLTGDIASVDTKTNDIKRNLDSTISTVSSNKADADGKISSMSTTITQLTNQITSKVDADGVKSTIEQNPDSVRIGFNKINNFVEITTASGIKVNHSDGSYTRMNGDGIARYVNGTAREYKYLTYYTEVVLREATTMVASMVGVYKSYLPAAFRVKGIKGFASIGTYYPFDGVNSYGDHPMNNPVNMISISPVTVDETTWEYRFSYNITGSNAVKSYWQLKLNLMFIA